MCMCVCFIWIIQEILVKKKSWPPNAHSRDMWRKTTKYFGGGLGMGLMKLAEAKEHQKN